MGALRLVRDDEDPSRVVDLTEQEGAEMLSDETATTATIVRKDGTESRFGREKGRKLFVALDPVGAKLGLGYSRRSLNERPQKDRNVASVEFAKTKGVADGGR